MEDRGWWWWWWWWLWFIDTSSVPLLPMCVYAFPSWCLFATFRKYSRVYQNAEWTPQTVKNEDLPGRRKTFQCMWRTQTSRRLFLGASSLVGGTLPLGDRWTWPTMVLTVISIGWWFQIITKCQRSGNHQVSIHLKMVVCLEFQGTNEKIKIRNTYFMITPYLVERLDWDW